MNGGSMMYHTVLIVLHRPPLSLQFTRTPAVTPDFAICWSSVTAIIRLIKQYSRGNEYLYLPVTFVHTATAAASIILLKRHIVHEDAYDEASKFLSVILSALGGCAATYPAAAQAKQAILMADEEVRMRMVNYYVKEEEDGDADVRTTGRELEQLFDLEHDSVMGGMGFGLGMGMGVGGVAGWMDPEWWATMETDAHPPTPEGDADEVAHCGRAVFTGI